jgi:hypothetical protein
MNRKNCLLSEMFRFFRFNVDLYMYDNFTLSWYGTAFSDLNPGLYLCRHVQGADDKLGQFLSQDI